MPTLQTLFTALCACACAAIGAGTAQAADVGVSVQVSQPGVYGRINIGDVPRLAPAPVVVSQQPVYLWVPPGHRKHWAKHCHKYDACGVPVYFVRQDWYDSHVRPARADMGPGLTAPGYSGQAGDHERHGHGHGHGHGRD